MMSLAPLSELFAEIVGGALGTERDESRWSRPYGVGRRQMKVAAIIEQALICRTGA